jgi:20S proteasome alpha/beta subunit
VTLAAGFRCTDGVVLCADTEMTIPGWIKYPESKLRLFNKLNSSPAFTFAGDAAFCNLFIHKIVRKIAEAEQNHRDVLAAIEDEVLKVHRMFSGESYEQESALILSLLGRTRGLLEIGQGKVNPVHRSCQGSGVLPTQSLLTELFSPDLSMRQTALLAIYLLAEGKTYGYGVGKNSQILLLSDKRWWAPFPDDPMYSKLIDIEDDYIQLKRLLRPILIAYSDLEVGKQKFAEITETFKTQISGRREKRLDAYNALLEDEIDRQIQEAEEWSRENAEPQLPEAEVGED